MITIQLWENPLYDGHNPKWMASAVHESGLTYLHSGDMEMQAIEGALNMLNHKLSPTSPTG